MATLAGTRILGLVGAGTPGGVRHADGPWYLVVHLAAWRDASGRLHEGDLRMELPTEQGDLQQLMKPFRPYSIVQAAVAEQPGESHVRLASLELSRHDDPELAAIAARLQRPVVLDAPPFGRLVFDRALTGYEGDVQWCGAPAKLHLSCFEDAAEPLLAIARRLHEDPLRWHERVTAFAADELLALKNDAWLDEDESPLDRAAFVARLRLESITIDSDGRFTFWFDDGELFFGHVVHVSGTLDDGPTEAAIAG